MEFMCEICNKKYSSYQSLWNHKNRYHINSIIHQPIVSHISTHSENGSTDDLNNYNYDYCYKLFKHRQSKFKHMLKCKELNAKKEHEIKEENKLINEKLDKIQNEIKQIKSKKKITNYINQGNIINGNNNIALCKPGFEDWNELTYEEVSCIFTNDISSVIKLIDIINFNKNKPKNNTYCSTAVQNAFVSFFNIETNTIDKERIGLVRKKF
jgi:hypothetical protein